MSELKEKLHKKVSDIKELVINEQMTNDSVICSNENYQVLQDVIKPIQNNNSLSLETVPSFAISLDTARERIAMLQEFVKKMMIPGQDYGLIPNVNKPTLFKPGAEKLCDIFGFSKQVEITNRMEDFVTGIFFYEIKVTLINKRTGFLEAEGVGCCNSKEKKYQYQSGFSIQNTILKMAKKRALIDAVLSATRSSGIFTQDVEDMNNNYFTSNYSKQSSKSDVMTKEQKQQIAKLVNSKKIPNNYIQSSLSKFGVTHSKELTKSLADKFISELSKYQAR